METTHPFRLTTAALYLLMLAALVWWLLVRLTTTAALYLLIPVALAWWLAGCTPSPRAQRLIDVACIKDAQYQPIIVPVVLVAAPLTGPAAPIIVTAATVDNVLIHPAVVAACLKYQSKPAAIVPAVPPGAVTTSPVEVEVTS